MHLSRKKSRRIIVIIAIIFLLFPFKKAYAQRFSWSGTLELSFTDRLEKSKSGDTSKETEQMTFRQRYNLYLNGPILNPRLGTFSIGTNFNHTWEDLSGSKSRSKDYGYNITTALFPQRFFPLTLYTNRYVSDTDSSTSSGTTTTTTYGLKWSLLLRGLPSMKLFIEQSQSTNDNPDSLKDERKRSASLELNNVAPSSAFFARYRYENSLDRVGNTTGDTHGIDMNYGSQITRMLYLRSFASYQTSASKDVADTDISLMDDINSGVGLYFHPLIYLDLTADYNFYYDFDESYSTGERVRNISRKHNASTTLYFHPDPRIDSRLGYYFTKTVSSTDIDNHQSALNINWKPAARLSLFGDASYQKSKSISETDISKAATQSYDIGFSHSLPYNNIIFNSSYKIIYGNADNEPGDSGSYITNSAGAGIAYNPRVALITTDYQFAGTRESRASVEDKDDHKFKIGISSYYIRGLAATATFEYDYSLQRKGEESWAKNETAIVDTKLDYNLWGGLFLGSGYSSYEYSNSSSNDTETLYAELRFVFYPMRNLYSSLKIREEWKEYSLNQSKNSLSGEAKLEYRIRRLSFSGEYSYTLEKQGAAETTKNNLYIKVTRTF